MKIMKIIVCLRMVVLLAMFLLIGAALSDLENASKVKAIGIAIIVLDYIFILFESTIWIVNDIGDTKHEK